MPILVLKGVLICYSPNPSCVDLPNLKSLDTMVAEISRESHNFWDAPLAQTPPILVIKVVSWQATPQTQVVY